MDLGLSGKVAMVAAASQGIGRACAEALAAEGCRVSVCGRHAETLAAVSAAEAWTVADVSRREELERWHAETEARLGQVDVLVTNTGGPPVARASVLSDEQWAAGVESTLMNVVRLSRLVLPGMRARRRGAIVHLTSFVAKQPSADLTVSSTLRAGLSALTRTMAAELGPDGVRVNAVLMGNVLTARQDHLLEARMAERGWSREQALAAATAEVPLGRMGEPREIGEVVAFLASERASYVTGVSLQIDGGLIRSTF